MRALTVKQPWAWLGRCDDSWVLEEAIATIGAIVGVVDLVAVHHDSDHGRGSPCSWWGQAGLWHLQVGNARPLAEPIRCKGRLGLWTLPAEVLAELEPLVCEDCEWVDVRALSDPAPRMRPGRRCQVHA